MKVYENYTEMMNDLRKTGFIYEGGKFGSFDTFRRFVCDNEKPANGFEININEDGEGSCVLTSKTAGALYIFRKRLNCRKTNDENELMPELYGEL